MTIKEALKKYPKIETELLLAKVLNKPKEFVFLHPEKSLSAYQLIRLSALAQRRLKGEPIAYIVGYKDFYGLRLKVNKNVLIPRPETEEMVGAVESRIKNLEFRSRPVKVLDVGTGSGCIAVALAYNLKPITYNLSVHASDISPKALQVAKQNARTHKVKVSFHRSDLLKGIKQDFDIIIANLPYGWGEWRNNSSAATVGLKFEPREALFTKEHGLYEIRRLLEQIFKRTRKPKAVFLEFDPRQKRELTKLVKKYFPKAKILFHKDLGKRWRFVEIDI